MRYPTKKLDGGLFLSGPTAEMPLGTLRRARGISALSTNSVKSRDGSTQLLAQTATSARYFNNRWFIGMATGLYRENNTGNYEKIEISGGPGRITYVAMPPTAGKPDCLFYVGTVNAFGVRKAFAEGNFYYDSTELITNGTMEADANWASFGTPTTQERSTVQVFEQAYSRKFTVNAIDEGIQGDTFTTVSTRFYECTCQVYPDDGTTVDIKVQKGDGSGFAYNQEHTGLTENAWNEITFNYYEPAGGAGAYIVFFSGDSTSGSWYIDNVSLVRMFPISIWGLYSPDELPTLANAGSGSGPTSGAVYKYRLTYLNSRTGTRSNPNALDTDYALLLHMDGADEGTTFTDSGTYTHTVSEFGNANTEQATKKFGTASCELDGTGDYLTVPNHSSLNPGKNNFTIDSWVAANDVGSSATAPGLMTVFDKYEDGNNYFRLHVYTVTGKDAIVVVYKSGGVVAFTRWNTVDDFVQDTFYHIAVIRGWEGDPNKFALTRNGTAIDTWTWTGEIANGGDLSIGRVGSGSNYLDGFVDEFRWVSDEALWTTGFTVPAAAAGSLEITSDGNAITVSGLVGSNQLEVDTQEIWRTVADGGVFFRLAAIDGSFATAVSSYTDNNADTALESLELPLDNLKPYAWFDSCYGPHNASMFWLTRSREGQRGRLFYSPVGRAEAVQGFIEVTEDTDPLQVITEYAGMLLVFSTAGLFQILGTNPYTARRVGKIPGTNSPYTVVTTPFGVFWEANDGIRVYTSGSTSILAAYDAIKPIFRGLSAGQLSSFTGVVATFARNEYLISDNTQAIAIDVNTKKWRDLGIGANALAYSEETDQILLGKTSSALDFENEGDADDAGTDITFEIEVPAIIDPRPEADVLCQRVVIDADTGNEVLEVALVVDGAETDLGDIQHNGRAQSELAAGKTGIEFSVRLSGVLDASAQCVEVHQIAFDIYDPVKGK